MINKRYAEIFNQALEMFYFHCENDKGRDAELRTLHGVAVSLYNIAFCAEDSDSMDILMNIIERLRVRSLPRPFDCSRNDVVWE